VIKISKIGKQINMEFEKVFDKRLVERDKFLSRIFGVFSEKIVEIWCKSPLSDYENLGRPTIKPINETLKGKTLDFTLLKKNTEEIYVTEMKCELQYENYKYLKLISSQQFVHHTKKDAFKWLLELGKNPELFEVKVKGKKSEVDGAALIWGTVDASKIDEICNETGLKIVLSLENMINDLIKENNAEYFDLLHQVQAWTSYLIDNLKGQAFFEASLEHCSTKR
jgi:hypothetical protein